MPALRLRCCLADLFLLFRLVAVAVTLLWISLGSHHMFSRVLGVQLPNSVCADKYVHCFPGTVNLFRRYVLLLMNRRACGIWL